MFNTCLEGNQRHHPLVYSIFHQIYLIDFIMVPKKKYIASETCVTRRKIVVTD